MTFVDTICDTLKFMFVMLGGKNKQRREVSNSRIITTKDVISLWMNIRCIYILADSAGFPNLYSPSKMR